MKKPLLFSCCLVLIAQVTQLKVEQPQLALSEDGTPQPADSQFLPGEAIFFSCRVSGFTRQGDEPPKMFISYQIDARDPKGRLILPTETGKVASELAPEDKEWKPKIRATLALPPLADSGRYAITVRVKDELGKGEASASIPLEIHGREVAASDTLTVRNFRFLRSEEDKAPLQVPAYRPGDTVWARFDMTGYKLGPKNEYDIGYGVKVLRPNGQITYEQTNAAADKNDSFYPQRYAPGVLSLNVPANMAKGQYTLLLTVRDHLGGQSYETRRTFDVE